MRKDRIGRYNPDWLATSSDIRLRRADNKCELCGRPYGALIRFEYNNGWRYANAEETARLAALKSERQINHWQRLRIVGLKQIVLTVAHLDHNERNDTPTNLLCMCQFCHLKYDRADNVRRRYYGYNGR